MKTFSTIACGLIAASIAAAPASAAVVMSLGGSSSSTDGTDGNIRTFNSSAVNVKAMAISLSTTGVLTRGWLGQYGSEGLGVTNVNEGNGGNTTHTVDNQNGNDFVMLVFDRAVNLSQAVLNDYKIASTAADNDAFVSSATYSSGAGANALTTYNWFGSSTLSTSQFNTLTASTLFSTLNTNGKNVQGNLSSGNLTNLNTGSTFANVWIIGAARSGYAGYDSTLDAFKLGAITINTGVPEPTTWAMMISGFGMIGYSMRRRRRVTVSFA